MSTAFELNTRPRDVFGTTASRRLRRSERVPAMVYGAGKDNEPLVLDHNEIMQNLGIEAFHSAIMSLNTDGLLYTSPSPRDVEESRMPSSA